MATHTCGSKKVVVTDKKLLTDYLANSVSLTIEYLEQVDEGTLDEVIDSNWTPPVTREDRLVSIIDDAVMHSGQGSILADW